jgi:hypothetical protein
MPLPPKKPPAAALVSVRTPAPKLLTSCSIVGRPCAIAGRAEALTPDSRRTSLEQRLRTQSSLFLAAAVAPGSADKKLSSTTHALPGFSPQPDGKSAVTGPALGRTGPASAAIGPASVGLGRTDKRLLLPPGAKPLMPNTAKPLVPTTPHPTPPPVVHQAMPSAPAVHQATLPPSAVHQAPPPPVVRQPAPPPARMVQSQRARPVAAAPHIAAPPPAVRPAQPPRPSAAGKAEMRARSAMSVMTVRVFDW